MYEARQHKAPTWRSIHNPRNGQKTAHTWVTKKHINELKK